MHTGENVAVVGHTGQYQPVVAEGIRHTLGHVPPGQICQNHLLPQRLQLPAQLPGSIPGVSVDGGVGNHHTPLLRPIGGPDVILFQIVPQILLQHRPVEGADNGDVQGRGSLQQLLYLHPVLAHNANVVAPGLVVPVLGHIQRTELAEAVGGEQHLVRLLIADHHLRPVHHGSKEEVQDVAPQGQHIPILHHQPLCLRQMGEKLIQHPKGLGVAHQRGPGMAL